MLLPPSGDRRRGERLKTAARRCRRSSSRVGRHMDPENFESIEFNCQFFTITARKEGIKQKIRGTRSGQCFHVQEGPAGVFLEMSALLKTTEQALGFWSGFKVSFYSLTVTVPCATGHLSSVPLEKLRTVTVGFTDLVLCMVCGKKTITLQCCYIFLTPCI